MFEWLKNNEAAEYTEQPEVTEIDEARECGVSFTEGGFDWLGAYEPGRVTEVNEDTAEEDESLGELKGEIDSWIHQSESMSCAVAVQTMVYNQTNETGVSESAMIDRGRQLQVYENGTAPENEGKILESLGYDIERTTTASRDALVEAANEGGTKVILHIDSLRMAFPHMPGAVQPDHAVQLMHVEKTENGEMAILNDPGREGGRGLVYPMEVLMKAWNGDMTTVREGANAL